MQKTPKSLRLQIGLFGRTNVGKSSFLNYVAGQDVAITSPVPGTTTDVVEKPMELLPLGPVVFLDTAGLDDTSVLAAARLKKTKKIFDRADAILIVTEPGAWGVFEEEVVVQARQRKTPVVIIVNKTDIARPSPDFLAKLAQVTPRILLCSCKDRAQRDRVVGLLKQNLIETAPEDFLNTPPLIGDLLPAAGLAVLIIPIDFEAPKGRIILPQVQAIRDALDHDQAVLVVKENDYARHLGRLTVQPDIVVCDSQVVHKMIAETPPDVPATTFSILLARQRGDLNQAVCDVCAIDRLKPGDKVLIAEACSHHAIEGDIGRVKIPKWLREYAGHDIRIDVVSGRDFPDNLKEYSLVIHCGSCMLTRRETLARIEKARADGVPLTNYGVAIAFLRGVLERALSPFPQALAAHRAACHPKK